MKGGGWGILNTGILRLGLLTTIYTLTNHFGQININRYVFLRIIKIYLKRVQQTYDFFPLIHEILATRNVQCNQILNGRCKYHKKLFQLCKHFFRN